MSDPPSEDPVLTQRWSWTHLQHRALVADVGEALVRAPTLGSALRACCEAMVAHLNAAFVRIWTLDTPSDTLELQASAGLYTHLDGPHARVAVGDYKIGRIAAARRPHLTNAVATDPEVSDHAWAERERLVSFAGYPLVIADQLVGVMALFARHALPADTLDALSSVSDTIALGIGRLRAMAALAEQQERYRLIQRATNDPIWDWDLRSDVVSWSEAIQTTFGYPLREVGTTGHWWSETIHPDDRDRILHSIHDAILGTTDTWTDEYRFRRRDGTYATVLDRGYLRRDGRGKAHRMVGSMLDVSAQRQAAHEREQLVVALTRSNQELDQFAYVASHDLKTPLRGIANLSQWIEDDLAEQASPDLRRHLTLLRDRAKRLDALIDGILDYSRAGRVRGQAEAIDLDTLVREATELLAPPAATTVEV
ncbi:MAG: PAS domain S-box protein, partial [Myxococcales bacterium]